MVGPDGGLARALIAVAALPLSDREKAEAVRALIGVGRKAGR